MARMWLYWCRGVTLERWRQECLLVEERFSLFRAFAEPPFLGFRGVVARSGCEYDVTVAAEMAGYIRNLVRHPRVRLKLRQGFGARWHAGTVHVLSNDDTRNRQRWLASQLPSTVANAAAVRPVRNRTAHGAD